MRLLIASLLALLCFTFNSDVLFVKGINYNALNKNQFAFTAFSQPHDTVAWGYEHYGGSTFGRTDVILNGGSISQVYSNERAFAVLLTDMTVVCYGSVTYGGDCHRPDSGHGVSTNLVNIVTISATRSAFAAINTDGQIFTWGVGDEGGDSTDYIAYWNLNKGNFTDLTSSDTAFAARSNDIVLSWGAYPASDIAHSTPSFASLDSVRFIQSNKESFLAVNKDGTGYTWGNQTGGGNSAAVTLVNIDAVFTTDCAFAVLKTDGSVITWGESVCGGDSSAVSASLASNVVSITSTLRAFAALKSDGSVITWGNEFYGGDHLSVDGTVTATTTLGAGSLTSSIIEVYSNEMAFAAKVSDGSVVTWGNSAAGGSSASLAGYTKCQDIIASSLAFVVLGTDGTATAWGDSSYGGDSSAVTLTNIEYIYASTHAFVALSFRSVNTGDYRDLTTWGDATYGGNFLENRMLRTDYVYGNEMFHKTRMNSPTLLPTSIPSNQPSGQPSMEPSGQPSGEPTKITLSPSGEPSGQPTSQPSTQPSAVAAPVLSGLFSSNFTYFCRPFHWNTSAPNGTSPLLCHHLCLCVCLRLSVS